MALQFPLTAHMPASSLLNESFRIMRPWPVEDRQSLSLQERIGRAEERLYNSEVLFRQGFILNPSQSKIFQVAQYIQGQVSDATYNRVMGFFSELPPNKIDIRHLVASTEEELKRQRRRMDPDRRTTVVEFLLNKHLEESLAPEASNNVVEEVTKGIEQIASGDSEILTRSKIFAASVLETHGLREEAHEILQLAVDSNCRHISFPNRCYYLAAAASQMITAGLLQEGWNWYVQILGDTPKEYVAYAFDAVSSAMFRAGYLLFSSAYALASASDSPKDTFDPDQFMDGVRNLWWSDSKFLFFP